MWTGIVVIGVVVGLFLLARLVMSGSLGRLRYGDKPADRWGNPGAGPAAAAIAAAEPVRRAERSWP
jgi:hypothetical protein